MLTRASRARIEKDGYVLNINISGRNGVPSLVYTEKLESAETFLQVKPILHRLKTVLMEK